MADEDLEADDPASFGARLAGTNINEQTLLATDYLNHFNEIVMILEMIPDLPDCLEDAREWTPKSYPDHFRDSGFSDTALAIAAYERSPARYRKPFDEAVGRMNALVAAGLDKIEAADGDGDQLRLVTASVGRALKRLMETANAIIHGSELVLEQTEIDRLLDG